VGVPNVILLVAAYRCGSEAASGPGLANSDKDTLRMAKSPYMHVVEDAFAAIAIFQILLVGLYCLPLVLPDRVSIMSLFVHPSVMKLASWENLFIESVHRWRAGRTCSLFLHYIKPFYDRFDLFHNWLLGWRSNGEPRVRDSRESKYGAAASPAPGSDVGMATHEPIGALGDGDNFGHANPPLSGLSLTVCKPRRAVVSLLLSADDQFSPLFRLFRFLTHENWKIIVKVRGACSLSIASGLTLLEKIFHQQVLNVPALATCGAGLATHGSQEN
jgi:hypothetical protein